VATLKAEGHEAEAAPGKTSQFDVIVDGETVFSKQESGRFPAPDEVLALVSGSGR
jgi:selT/selW/selH-like putative selenoprotein